MPSKSTGYGFVRFRSTKQGVRPSIDADANGPTVQQNQTLEQTNAIDSMCSGSRLSTSYTRYFRKLKIAIFQNSYPGEIEQVRVFTPI